MLRTGLLAPWQGQVGKRQVRATSPFYQRACARLAVIQTGPAVWQGPGALLFVHHVLVAFRIQQVGELARIVQLDAEQPASAVGV